MADHETTPPPPPARVDRPSTSAPSISPSPANDPSSPSSSSHAHASEEQRREDGEDNVVEEVEENHSRGEEETAELIRPHRRRSLPFRINRFPPPPRPPPPPPEEDESAASMFIRDDTWSCVIVILTFWFFVSLTLIMGIFGSETLELSPYTSILLQPNPIFVQYIKVEKSDITILPVLYGLHKPPPLNDTKTWSKNVSVSLQSDTRKEWLFFLNKGSYVSVSYNINTSSPLLLIIARGYEEMSEWVEDPSYPNTTLSWNVISGNGTIKQDIATSSQYYVAVGNLNTEDIEIKLSLQIRSTVYDTSNAYYNCSLSNDQCSLKVHFPAGTTAVMTSPGPQQETQIEQWYVKLSYEPRWLTYILGIGGMTLLMLAAFHLLNKIQFHNGDRGSARASGWEPERAPLLTHKDDDLSSWGSSYDSGSNDDEEQLEDLEKRLYQGKAVGDTENGQSVRQLCVICFDAPRDCFFLPCGHCAACFTCATRIAEAAGTCPICRRKMKKVRKIFTV